MYHSKAAAHTLSRKLHENEKNIGPSDKNTGSLQDEQLRNGQCMIVIYLRHRPHMCISRKDVLCSRGVVVVVLIKY
jgi:hypothetical protein